MEENINQKNWSLENEQTTSLDSLEKEGSVPDTVSVKPQDTVISRLNAETPQNTPAEEIKLENFSVPTANSSTSKIVLWDSGIQIHMPKKIYVIKYFKIFIRALISIAVFGLAALVLWLYNKYLTLASQAVISPQDMGYVNDYKSVQNFLRSTLWDDAYTKYATLDIGNTNGKESIRDVLGTKYTYVTKKDILQTALNSFSPKLIQKKQSLENLRQEVTKYGFFSKELYDLLQNEEYVTSIKESLLSLEMIKFSSAIKVFSYLDTFIWTVASVLNISVPAASNKITEIAQRWEKDIALYLSNCYLNPYEVDYDCNLVWDFDRYYTNIAQENDWIDRVFFKKLMTLIDLKLEQTSLPSFAITFQKFDPTQRQISFKVEVNTFQQDEAALAKRGIINPHIFIVTNLLNLIKQSLYVLSENIDAKTLKIVPKTIKIGSTVFTVNNSMMNFILPIQKSTEREITDYTSQDILHSSK